MNRFWKLRTRADDSRGASGLNVGAGLPHNTAVPPAGHGEDALPMNFASTFHSLALAAMAQLPL
jgi:hypothetical protein